MRRDIDRKPHKIKAVLTNDGIRRAFFGGCAADEKKAVKAFVNQTSNRSTALKKHPKVSDEKKVHPPPPSCDSGPLACAVELRRLRAALGAVVT